jgi:MinD-like ATPase involved in chromosome partitioning or flagellar assembly/ActR/RegA family two-component response regulator
MMAACAKGLRMPQKKILVIDSDVASRNFIARRLQEQHFDVLQAGSGREGLIYTWRDRPDLVIADPTLADLKGEEIAAKLRNDIRSANLPLIALSSDPAVTRSTACLEAGFNDYIVKSGEALSRLSDSISRTFGFSNVSMKQGGLMIVFLSAKGGTGTSSICANMAMNIARNEPNTHLAVIDLVLPIGSIASLVGYEGSQNIVTIADAFPMSPTSDSLRPQLPEIMDWNFSLLAGSPNPDLGSQLKMERIPDIIKAIKASYDYVLVDIGCSLSHITLPIIQHADQTVLLINTEASAISLTKILWDYFARKGMKSGSIYPILNHAVSVEGLNKAESERLLGISINSEIPHLGANFAFANNHHLPFTIKFPNDPAVLIFQEAAKEIAVLARTMRVN